jgi:hypothetical protein
MKVQIKEDNGTLNFRISHDDENFLDVASCTPEAFAQKFIDQSNFLKTGILPPAIRYLSPNRRFFIWERPPTYATVNYVHSYQATVEADSVPHATYRIPLPWQRYLVYLDNTGYVVALYLSLHAEQMQSLDEYINFAPFPNFYAENYLCLALYNHLPEGNREVAYGTTLAYNMLWNSGFNRDIFDAFAQLINVKNNPLSRYTQNPGLCFKVWSNYPLEQVLTWPWASTGITFNQFIKNQIYTQSVGNDDQASLVSLVWAAQEAAQL